MLIKKIMTQKVVSVEPDDTLKTLNEIFSSVKFHHLLVVEDDRLCGVISDRDLLKTMSPFIASPSERPIDQAIMNKKAHQIMSRELVTISLDATAQAAKELLLKCHVSCLPVVDDQHKIVGILSWKDLMRHCL